ncbi:MAG: TRAP transporter small permease [Lachnospiraceae bacterium]|nr:TRAP transporter small permease [Lachnospiraceae bacterium]
MPAIFEKLDKVKPFYDAVSKVLMVICKLFLIVDILITSMAVAGRYIPFIPDPSWSEEVVLTCMSYMAVLSAALAIRRKAHIRMTAFDRYLPANLLKTLDLIADIAVLILGGVMLILGFNYATTIGSRGTYVSMPGVSRFWMYFPIPLAGFFMVIFELEAIVNDIKAFFRKDTEYDLKNQAERMIKEAQS